MKCPWQMIETKTEKEIDVYGRLVTPQTKSISFADCIKDECPFFNFGSEKCRRAENENSN